MLRRLRRGREKLFGDGRTVPLDRNAKIRVLKRAHALTRRTEKGRAYGAITAKAHAVLRALAFDFHNAGKGRCFPSYAKIAEAVGCAVSTVGKALKMLEETGLLTWCNRLVRIKVYEPGLGWRKRVIRTSNAYVLIDPQATDRAPQAPARARNSSNTEKPSGTRNQEVSLADAPSRRGSLPGGTPLENAIAKLGKALSRRQGPIPKPSG